MGYERDIEIAWAAGVFEGEGSTTLHRGRFAAQLKNTDLEPLTRFHRAIQAGVIYGPYTYRGRKTRQKKAFWIWVGHGAEGVWAIREVAPHLSDRRLVQAQAALSAASGSVCDLADDAYAFLRRLRQDRVATTAVQ